MLHKLNQVSMAVIRNGFPVIQGPFTSQGLLNELEPILDNVYEDMAMSLNTSQGQVSYYHPTTRKNYILDIREQYLTPGNVNALIVVDITSKFGKKTSYISLYSIRNLSQKSKQNTEQQSVLSEALAILDLL